MNLIVLSILLLCERLTPILSSDGDSSSFYRNCLKACMIKNCTQDGSFTSNAASQQDMWCQLLLWSCRDECCYNCMWKTVHSFKEAGHWTPKFHGKWPFVRLLGVQEPASTFSSLLNLAAHVYMYVKIRREFPVRTMPLVLFWHLFAVVCINAWVWSTIFHMRDKPFTEFMDYACALSMVMGLFVAAIVRVFHRKRKLTALVLTFPLFYFITHVRYLYSGSIDYDYNMMVNVVFGVAGSLIWLGWSCYEYIAGRRYAWRMIAFTVLSGAALSLELLDFPPKYYTWDAHALWHLSTAPLPLLFYRVVIEDLRFLQTRQIDKSVLKLT